MSGFFKNMFGKKEGPRTISSATELQVGDFVQFTDSFGLPEDIRGQSFEIQKIHTYEFEHDRVTEYLVQGTGETFYLSVEEENDEEFIAISKRVNHNLIEEIFNVDEFCAQFETKAPSPFNTQSKPAPLTDYLADAYKIEIQGQRGFYHLGDHRGQTSIEEEGEPFDYYFFTGSDDKFAIDATVYGNGETEVSATLYRPLTDIESMWPKAN
jgi:hypothetical protein